MTSVFNVSLKSGHFKLFPKYCVFLLVFYPPTALFFSLPMTPVPLFRDFCKHCMEFMNFLYIYLIFSMSDGYIQCYGFGLVHTSQTVQLTQ